MKTTASLITYLTIAAIALMSCSLITDPTQTSHNPDSFVGTWKIQSGGASGIGFINVVTGHTLVLRNDSTYTCTFSIAQRHVEDTSISSRIYSGKWELFSWSRSGGLAPEPEVGIIFHNDTTQAGWAYISGSRNEGKMYFGDEGEDPDGISITWVLIN